MPVTRVPKTTPEAQLRSFIAKFDARNQALIRAVRRALRKRLPTATELVYDNYNFFVIGYSPTPRPSDAVLSIAAGANGVGLCFIQGAGLPDPKRVLQGSGKQTRFLLTRLGRRSRTAGSRVADIRCSFPGEASSRFRAGRPRHPIRFRETAAATTGALGTSRVHGAGFKGSGFGSSGQGSVRGSWFMVQRAVRRRKVEPRTLNAEPNLEP